MRAILDDAPSEPDETIYARLRRWVRDVYVEPASYEQSAVFVELWKDTDKRAA